MQTGDIRLIKNINDRLVLNLIREHEIISGADLAHITGMRPSTISNILKGLNAKSLIFNRGKGESTYKGGKRPFLWSLKGDAAYIFGIDVEIGEITATVLNLNGENVAKKVYRFNRLHTIEELVAHIKNSVNDIASSARINGDRILGMGVAVAGVVNSDTGYVVTTDISKQLNIPLKPLLEKEFDFPIMIENNANCAAVGAKWVGSAKGCKNFMTVLIEMNKDVGGMGIGLILSDELYHGSTYCSGELNIHLPTLSSTLGTLRNRLEEGKILKDYALKIDELDIYTVIDAALNGDTIAELYFSILGHLIGKSISRSVALINPEKLILAGDVAELGDLIIAPIKKVIEMEILNISSCVKIATSIHGRYSVAMGSASLLLNEFFKVPVVKSHNLVNL